MQTSDARLIIDLADAVRNAAPIQKDPEAAQLISQLVGSQPDALYFLVQTVLLQKEALAAQQAQPAPATGASSAAPAAPPASPRSEEQRGRWGGLFGSRRQSGPDGGAAGGSFLKTAAAGAAGVAGGVLLAQGISGLLSAPQDQHRAEDDEDDFEGDDDGWDSF